MRNLDPIDYFMLVLRILLACVAIVMVLNTALCAHKGVCYLTPPPTKTPNRACEGLREYPTPEGNVICAKNDEALTGRIYPRNWPVEGA